MKNGLPPGLIIGAIVVLVLLAIGVAFKSLSGGNPPRENLPASAIQPDPLPAGMDASHKPPAPGRGGGNSNRTESLTQ